MNPRTTIGLLLLAGGLSTYIFFFEWPGSDADAREERGRKLFPNLDPAKVTSIEIIRSNNIIRVERTNDQWQLTAPGYPNYPAQVTYVQNWLALLGTLNRRADISAQELLTQPGGRAAFGLDNPQATVTVQQGPERTVFHVGSKSPVGGRLYLQLVGSDGIVVTESVLADRLPQSSTDWRDPTFLALAGLNISWIYVRAGTRDLELQRDTTGRFWRLTKPRSARADNGLLQQRLRQLQTVRISQFVSDVPGSDLEPYGLQAPEVTLAFGEGTNRVLTVDFGRSPTNEPTLVYARRSNYPNIVTVPRSVVDLLRVPYTEFLDRRLIEFAADGVNRIEVRAAESFALDKQTNGGWRGVEPVGFPADPALVAGFLDRLNALQIAEVAKEVATDTDLPDYGLAPPARRYILKGSNGGSNTDPVLAQVEFGTNRADKVYVRRVDETSVYALKPKDTLDLPQAAYELRDRRIWNFTTNQVVSVTIALKDKRWKLLRSGTGQWAFAPGSQGILINPYALEEALFGLGQRLRSIAWVACGEASSARFGFKEAAHKLSIELNSSDKPETLTVEFGGPSASGGPYAAIDLETGRTVFEFPFEIFQVYSEVVRSLTAAVGRSP